jgi:hypothetical protein
MKASIIEDHDRRESCSDVANPVSREFKHPCGAQLVGLTPLREKTTGQKKQQGGGDGPGAV